MPHASPAVQVGTCSGARVIGASSHGHDAVRALGASLALRYDELAQLPPLDVVLEMAGGDVYRAALRRLAPMGRIVLAGASAAFPRSRNPLARLKALRDFPRANILDMLRRSYGVMSFHVGWLLDSGAIASQWRDLVAFVEGHGIRPVVGREFAFEEIGDAQRVLEERGNVGKVVVHLS